MRHTLGQVGQRPWTWVLVAEEWRHKDCTDGQVRTWQGPWELKGVKESRQEQAPAPEKMTQRE